MGSDPSVKSNGVAIAFANATANWGTVLSAYIIDAATLGKDLSAHMVYGTATSAAFAALT